MAVLRVWESGTIPRTGELSVSGRNYTRHLKVLSDTTNENPVSIYPSLVYFYVAWGQYYRIYDTSNNLVNYDTGSFITSIGFDRDKDSPFLWDVTVGYSPFQLPGMQHPTNMPARSGGDPNQNPNIQPNPLLRPYVYHWASVPKTKILDNDIAGFPVVNSAKQNYTSQPQTEEHISRLSVTRNEATTDGQAVGPFDASQMDVFRNTLNQTQFVYAAAGRARMTDIAARKVYEGEVQAYWEVTYVIDIMRTVDWFNLSNSTVVEPDGTAITPPYATAISPWDLLIADKGRRQLNGDPCRDKDGRPATIDMPLDGLGVQRVAGADPVYLRFVQYRRENWNLLALV